MKYSRPIIVKQDNKVFIENEGPKWYKISAWGLAALGGAWAWCNIVCGWGNIHSCEVGWINVKAECK